MFLGLVVTLEEERNKKELGRWRKKEKGGNQEILVICEI